MQSVWRNNAVVMFTLLGLVGTSCMAGQHKLSSQRQAVASTLTASTATARAKVQVSYSQLPLHFEANRGQSDQQVKFLSRGNGYVLFLTPTEAVLSLQKRGSGEMAKRKNGEERNSQPATLRMQLAHVHLAISYLAQWLFQLSPDSQALAQASAAAQRVIALNDAFPWGHSVLGFVYLCQKQYEQAIAEMERAIALAPNDVWGYVGLAEMLGWMGRPEEGLLMVEQALRRKPPSIMDEHLASIGAAYYLAGRPEEAIAPLKQYINRYPNILDAHLTLTAAYSELGKGAEARAEAAEVLRLNPNYSLEIARKRSPLERSSVPRAESCRPAQGGAEVNEELRM